MEALITVNRVNSITEFRRYIRVTRARPRENTACKMPCVLLGESGLLICDCFFECRDCGILLRLFGFILPDRLLLRRDLGGEAVDLRLLVRDQRLHAALLRAHALFGSIQRFLLFFKVLFGEADLLCLLRKLLQLLLVIVRQHGDIGCPVEHIREASGLDQDFQVIAVPAFIDEFDALFHHLVLIVTLFLGLCKFLFLLGNLRLLRTDLLIEIVYLSLHRRYLRVQICHILLQVLLGRLQIFLDGFQVTDVALDLPAFLFALLDRSFLLPDAVICQFGGPCTKRRRGSADAKKQCAHKYAPPEWFFRWFFKFKHAGFSLR